MAAPAHRARGWRRPILTRRLDALPRHLAPEVRRIVAAAAPDVPGDLRIRAERPCASDRRGRAMSGNYLLWFPAGLDPLVDRAGGVERVRARTAAAVVHAGDQEQRHRFLGRGP